MDRSEEDRLHKIVREAIEDAQYDIEHPEVVSTGILIGALKNRGFDLQRITELEAGVVQALAERDKAEAERDRLREALEKYGRHRAAPNGVSCAYWYDRCNCGLDEALKCAT